MLIDEVAIIVTGGHGGPGKASYFRKGRGPDGGNGGKGGDVYFQAVNDIYALSFFSGQKNFVANAGEPGGSNRKSGNNAPDLILYVPLGSEITDLNTSEKYFLNSSNEKLLVAKGGIGGLGTADRANARLTSPKYAQHGMPGQKKSLKLELKLIADFGLIGLPNAGKSSLLNALTSAQAKVGDYSFTTLEPNLGVCDGKVIADIPGLIEGASTGKGLGIKFLKHIEKVPVILHCLGADSLDPKKDYTTIREELKKYSPELLKKKEIILLTKTDLVDQVQIKNITKLLKKKGVETMPVSILDDQSLEALRKKLNL